MNSTNVAFLSGSAFALCTVCLMQDWLGLEGYIDHIRAHWIDTPWQIWPPMILLSLITPAIHKRIAGAAHD